MPPAARSNVIGVITAAYPNATYTPASIEALERGLAAFEEQEVIEAVRRLIDRPTPFPPVLGEIRHEIATARRPDLPDGPGAIVLLADSNSRLAPELKAAMLAWGGRQNIVNDAQGVRRLFLADWETRRLEALREALDRGPTLAALPESTSAVMRPLTARLARQKAGGEVGDPSEAEISDAIRVLEEGAITDDPSDDPLYTGAEKLLETFGR